MTDTDQTPRHRAAGVLGPQKLRQLEEEGLAVIDAPEPARTTEEVVYDTILDFLQRRVEHHEQMADMVKEPLKSDHKALAEAFGREARSFEITGALEAGYPITQEEAGDG